MVHDIHLSHRTLSYSKPSRYVVGTPIQLEQFLPSHKHLLELGKFG